MFPKITTSGKNDRDAGQADAGGESIVMKSIPVIPPKTLRFEIPINITDVDDKNPSWFIVMTPREIKGVGGPYTINQMRELYKLGDVKESTLVWQEGEDNWKQLRYNHFLRPKLIQLPVIPPKANDSNGLYNNNLDFEMAQVYSEAKKLPSYRAEQYCAKCGNVATNCIPSGQEQVPDLRQFSQEVGSTELASEVIPGLLWIGNFASSKIASLSKLGITLSINCTGNLPHPPLVPPFSRCISIPMREKPTEMPSSFEKLLVAFEKAFDSIDYERLYPERAVAAKVAELAKPKNQSIKQDQLQRQQQQQLLLQQEHLGKQQILQMQQSKKAQQQIHPQHRKFEEKSRVLLWSKQGFDRPCVLGVAYLIKRYGVTLERAMAIVRSARPGMDISPCYYAALEEWSKKHTVGEIICNDCCLGALQTYHARNQEKYLEENGEDLYKEFLKQIQDNHRLQSTLSDPTIFLPKLYNSRDISTQWSGLMDLKLPGRSLGDKITMSIFQIFADLGISHRLRVIDFSSNLIGDDGLQAITTSLLFSSVNNGSVGRDTQIMHLDVSQNLIEEEGAKSISIFLQQCNSITSLNVSDNKLGDRGGVSIFSSLIRPATSYFKEGEDDDNMDDDDDDDDEEEEDRDNESTGYFVEEKKDAAQSDVFIPYNFSLTDLRIANNKLGHEASETLVSCLKKNCTLTSLHLGMNPTMASKDMKHFLNACRVYNSTIQKLSFSDMRLTKKSVEYISRIVQGQFSILNALDLSSCKLLASHIVHLAETFPESKYLTYLNLSQNGFGDEGAEQIAKALKGTYDPALPPIRHLDVACCKFTPKGCQAIITAVSQKPTVRYLDLSSNDMGNEISNYSKSVLSKCRCEILRLNNCKISSKGANAIFDVLGNYTLAHNLKALYLADNFISDASSNSVKELLQYNRTIELIDLGFNKFTSESTKVLQSASSVNSFSSNEKKLLDLTVNLVGNECDPYIMDTPAKSRSKNTFRYGIASSSMDKFNNGYSHISQESREHFLGRKKFYDEYQQNIPRISINTLS